MAKLVIFSGPPGVGKSTLSYALAHQTGWTLLPKDGIDRALEKVELDTGRGGYEVLFDLSRLNLQQGTSVILDAVFTTDGLKEKMLHIGKETNAEIYLVVCGCSDENVWHDRILKRPEVVDGWTPADWEEVKRVQGLYSQWKQSHIELDAVDPLDENLQKLFEYVGVRT